MSESLTYAVMAALVGALIPLQTGANSTIRMIVGHPVYAVLVNFGVGAVAILSWIAIARFPLPPIAKLASAPWWAFTGGLVGAVYVVTVSVVARKLGATPLLFLVLAGQIISSLVCDHFGLIGFEKSPITLSKIAGIALVIFGVLMIRR